MTYTDYKTQPGLTDDQLDNYYADYIRSEREAFMEAYREYLGTIIGTTYDNSGNKLYLIDMGKDKVILVNDEVLTRYKVTDMLQKEINNEEA